MSEKYLKNLRNFLACRIACGVTAIILSGRNATGLVAQNSVYCKELWAWSGLELQNANLADKIQFFHNHPLCAVTWNDTDSCSPSGVIKIFQNPVQRDRVLKAVFQSSMVHQIEIEFSKCCNRDTQILEWQRYEGLAQHCPKYEKGDTDLVRECYVSLWECSHASLARFALACILCWLGRATIAETLWQFTTGLLRERERDVSFGKRSGMK